MIWHYPQQHSAKQAEQGIDQQRMPPVHLRQQPCPERPEQSRSQPSGQRHARDGESGALPITIHQRGEQRVIERQAHADSGQGPGGKPGRQAMNVSHDQAAC